MKKSFVEVSYSIWICRLLQHNWLLCIRTPDSFLKWVRCLAQDIQITGAVSFQITWLCCNLPPQHSDNCPYNWGGREGKEKKKTKKPQTQQKHRNSFEKQIFFNLTVMTDVVYFTFELKTVIGKATLSKNGWRIQYWSLKDSLLFSCLAVLTGLCACRTDSNSSLSLSEGTEQ